MPITIPFEREWARFVGLINLPRKAASGRTSAIPLARVIAGEDGLV
jgi:hypothetical protein